MLDFCRRDDAGLFDIPFLMKFFWWDALPGLKESDTVLNNFWHCEEHPHDVILRRACNAKCVETIQFQCSCRTSQWMHDATFSHRFLFLPRRWALGHLPVGIPSGQKTNRFVVEGFCRKLSPDFRPMGLEIGAQFPDFVLAILQPNALSQVLPLSTM